MTHPAPALCPVHLHQDDRGALDPAPEVGRLRQDGGEHRQRRDLAAAHAHGVAPGHADPVQEHEVFLHVVGNRELEVDEAHPFADVARQRVDLLVAHVVDHLGSDRLGEGIDLAVREGRDRSPLAVLEEGRGGDRLLDEGLGREQAGQRELFAGRVLAVAHADRLDDVEAVGGHAVEGGPAGPLPLGIVGELVVAAGGQVKQIGPRRQRGLHDRFVVLRQDGAHHQAVPLDHPRQSLRVGGVGALDADAALQLAGQPVGPGGVHIAQRERLDRPVTCQMPGHDGAYRAHSQLQDFHAPSSRRPRACRRRSAARSNAATS